MDHDENHETESPQIYDRGCNSTKRSFIARLILPFYLAQYKTDVTSHCLLKALNSRVVPIDTDTGDETDETALIHPPHSQLWKSPEIKHTFHTSTFFSLYHAHLQRAAPLLFRHLRKHVYNTSEASYQSQFTAPLRPVDGLGFSGSLFYYTADRLFLVKSVGRRFEYTFLYVAMMAGYAFYCTKSAGATLLSRIMDVVYTFDHRIGEWLGVSPAHYLVMANVLWGFDPARGCRKWDLKPQNFFEPTRDLVPDPVKSAQAKSGLADELDEEIILTQADRGALMQLLQQDTAFLEDMRTIDYSLLLGRYPVDMFHYSEDCEDSDEYDDPGDSDDSDDPMVLPKKGSHDFAKGVRSADGKWVYKMCIVDFLWNVQQLQPKVLKTAASLLPEQTVTTEPGRYRKEFLNMMDEYIKVRDEQE